MSVHPSSLTSADAPPRLRLSWVVIDGMRSQDRSIPWIVIVRRAQRGERVTRYLLPYIGRGTEHYTLSLDRDREKCHRWLPPLPVSAPPEGAMTNLVRPSKVSLRTAAESWTSFRISELFGVVLGCRPTVSPQVPHVPGECDRMARGWHVRQSPPLPLLGTKGSVAC